MESLFDKLKRHEAQLRKQATYELLIKSTSGVQLIEELIDGEETLFGTNQKEFIKKVLRMAVLDTLLHASCCFRDTLNTDEDLRTHVSAWTDIVSELRNYMVTIDPQQTFEENNQNNWQ
jgi:hypothetical protein